MTTWDEVFDAAVEHEVKIMVHHYGNGMFTVQIGEEMESDLTDKEARRWLEERIDGL